jgi:signal transduction histidine kinase/PAS domain-containing protein
MSEQAETDQQYRALLAKEQRRVAHLTLINDVQRSILSSHDYETFLPIVAQILSRHFVSCEVAIYLCDPLPDKDETVLLGEPSFLKLAACAGEVGILSAECKERDYCVDFALRVAQDQQVRCQGFALQIGMGCEPRQSESPLAALAIPIIQQKNTLGVLALCSANSEAIEADELTLLQMIASFLAMRIETSLTYTQARDLGSFLQRLFSSMLHSLLVVDSKGRIHSANERFCQTVGLPQNELKGALLTDILDSDTLEQSGLFEALVDVTENGVPHELEGVQLSVPGVQLPDAPLVFDIRIFRVFYRHQAQAVLLFINLTSRWRGFHQLQLMSEIGRYFSASLHIDTVLRTVLTCITAGNGLGFNRAFLLLVDENKRQLKGTLALGASSASEAQYIWHELAKSEWNLQQILDAAENVSESLTTSQLQKQLSELVIDLDNPLFPAIQTSLNEHRTLRVSQSDLLAQLPLPNVSEAHHAQWQQATLLFNASEMVLSPLLAKDRLVGVVLADNVFSGNLIEDADVQLLDSLAGQAGLTIDNAQAYQALEKAQKELVNSERLAVVGDMTARLSHEIRNPLATIGGFAQRLRKNPNDVNGVIRNATVILEETTRLEGLLDDLLQMARPEKINLQREHLSDIVDQALLLADADIRALKVQVETNYDPTIPEVLLDRARLLQALLNIIINGAQAMPNGGVLRINTSLEKDSTVQIRIQDGGKGISSNALKHVFDPFYSTKIKGSGLGLAITWRIIQDHGGKIEVESEINEGTTFIISLPLRTAHDE